jgi:hypothetical protein
MVLVLLEGCCMSFCRRIVNPGKTYSMLFNAQGLKGSPRLRVGAEKQKSRNRVTTEIALPQSRSLKLRCRKVALPQSRVTAESRYRKAEV